MDKIFNSVDRDKNGEITYEELLKASEEDPALIQVRITNRTSHCFCIIDHAFSRPYPNITVSRQEPEECRGQFPSPREAETRRRRV